MASHFKQRVPELDMDEPAARPNNVDPNASGTLSKLKAGQGAVVTSRSNARHGAEAALAKSSGRHNRLSSKNRPKVRHKEGKVKTNRALFIVLAIAAVAVVGVIGFMVYNAANSVHVSNTPPMERTTSTLEQGVTVNGRVYGFKTSGDKYTLVSQNEDGTDTNELFQLNGKPVSIIAFDGALVIGENMDGKWDVVAYTIGDASMASQLVGKDGNPVTGDGQLSSSVLEGSTLLLTTSDGKKTTVPLA
jgi:hypothetical protein